MTIHPAIAARFALLEGITSFEQAMADPELEARFHGGAFIGGDLDMPEADRTAHTARSHSAVLSSVPVPD